MLAEDSAELRPDHPHVVRLEARPANPEGAGLVGLDDMVRQALRMLPDRLVVAEVRGPEVVALLAAWRYGRSSLSSPAPRTNVPFAGRVATTPRSRSSATARRTVPMLTP